MDFECDGASAIEESKAEYNEVSEDAQAPAIETPETEQESLSQN